MTDKKVKTKSQIGKMSRNKGRVFEQLIARMFKAAGYPKCQRQLEYQISDDLGVDLSGTGIYGVQLKRLKKYSTITAIEEVKPKDGRIPVLITKADNKPIMAVIPFEHFLELVRVK